ncbi:hypothetical protein BZG36_04491 [Bifiguratus adelaidae]|uniref:Cytochrome P450 n=1 Tax=Bifiguratus adelaidae TaxID=1938954 RepID=A0A261XYF5_9FUNG|nr:hypothetical protein BZG36_04491 [Bifiguratus adelaidae]
MVSWGQVWVFCSIPISIVLAAIVNRFMWAGRNADGTPKQPLPPYPKQGRHWLYRHAKLLGAPLSVTLSDAKGFIPAYKRFTQWSNELGEIFCVQLGETVVMVLNSPRAVYEVLVEKQVLNSTRSRLDIVEEVMTRSNTLLDKSFDESWRQLRRFLHDALGSRGTDQWDALIEGAVDDLVVLLRKAAEKEETIRIKNYVDFVSLSVMLRLAFGKKVDIKDPILARILDDLHDVEAAQQGFLNRWSRAFPLLKVAVRLYEMLPGTKLDKLRKQMLTPFIEMYMELKEALGPDGNKNVDMCLAKYLLTNEAPEAKVAEGQRPPKPLDDEIYLINLVHLIHHGHVYVSTALLNTFSLLASHSEIQSQAREVAQQQRPLKLQTSNRIPFIRAIVKESLRLRTPAYLGIPHAARIDQTLVHPTTGTQYRLEEFAPIIINAHAIHRNPSNYPNPDQFDPARWLSAPYPKGYTNYSSYDLYMVNLQHIQQTNEANKAKEANEAIRANADESQREQQRLAAKKTISSKGSATPAKVAEVPVPTAPAHITPRDHFAFGAGRRICLGAALAERALVHAVASTLANVQLEAISIEEREISSAAYTYWGRTEIDAFVRLGF